MKQEENYKISLAELSLKSKAVIAQMPATNYAKALAQVQQLKKNSNTEQCSKKSRVKY